MKIIQNGKPKTTIRRFRCTECNCIFEADKHEYITGTQYNETYYRCPCPECGKNSTELSTERADSATRPNSLIGIIGQLGPYCAQCPACGNQNLLWDHFSDVTSCPQCGWDNQKKAEDNRQKRIKNGEVC